MKKLIFIILAFISLQSVAQRGYIGKTVTYIDTTWKKCYIRFDATLPVYSNIISVNIQTYLSEESMLSGENQVRVPEIPYYLEIIADSYTSSTIKNIVKEGIKTKLLQINKDWKTTDIKL